MALSTHTKGCLDTMFGAGGAAKMIALNASGTALDGPTRSLLAYFMGGIGEATAFEAAVNGANGAVTISQAATNHLTRHLRGAGAVADFLANGNA